MPPRNNAKAKGNKQYKRTTMNRFLLALVVMMGCFSASRAQQDAVYSMYMFNGLFINPAYAGSHEVISTMGIYRHQWAGFEGAPRTANISVHSPFRRDQYAMGGVLSYDRLGFTGMFTASTQFSYRLKIRQARLCFGMSASFTHYQQLNSNAILPDGGAFDNSFAVDRNLFMPNFGFGIYAYGKKWYIGASVPHLLPNSLTKNLNLSYSQEIARQYNHYLLTGGYVFGKDAAIVKVRPSFLMRYVQGLRNDIPKFDINLALLFIDRFWIGAGYRFGGDADNYRGEAIIALA
jgi:type IX secretion system PorP/SprF family membrane protein